MNFYKSVLYLFLNLFFFALSPHLLAQNGTIHGIVSDATTSLPLAQAKIQIIDASLVTLSDSAGSFRFFIPVKPGVLLISCEGYESKEILTKGEDTAIISIRLTPLKISLRQTVYMPSREIEPVEQSPIDVEKTEYRQIEHSPSSDFYQDIGELKAVDVVTSSAFLKVLNMGGFAETRQLRVKQFVDGVDNESPGLNVPLGNMNGVNELDLQSTEIAFGPASVIYGNAAMQGIIAMGTKSPYDFKGLSIQLLDGGTTVPGSYFDAQLRYANTFGKENRFAIKITGEFTQMKEWQAANDSLNLYGNTKDEVNLNSYIQNEANAPYCPTCPVTTAQHNYYVTVANWLASNPVANNFDPSNPKTGFLNVQAPGYTENSIANNNPNNGKLSAGIYYHFDNALEFSATYRLGYNSSVYQAMDRYQLKNYLFQQPVIQMKGKNFFVRVYGSFENSGQSYSLSTVGKYLSRSAESGYISNFTNSYFNTIDTLVGGFSNCVNCLTGSYGQAILDSARKAARGNAQSAWYVPGTPTFNDTFNNIISNKNATRFYNQSALVHLDAQYNWDFVKWLDIIMGASYRIYMPNSSGTFLQDTSGMKIREEDGNIFLQITKRLFKDRFKITTAINVDKNSNFRAIVSPRGALIYMARTKSSSHTFRLSASTGFRIPSMQEQFAYLDEGNMQQIGNLNGLSNLYTLSSVNNSLTIYNRAQGNVDSVKVAEQALMPIALAALKPERVTSFEFEYRAEIKSRILISLSAHYNIYNNLIGYARVVAPNANGTTNGMAGDSSGASNVFAGNYTPVQTWANIAGQIKTWYGAISVSCYAGSGITPYVNYTYSDCDNKNSTNNQDIMQPGFNTPKHKVNVGINATRIVGGFGFTINWKWVTSYQWNSWFASGTVPSYNTLDMQIYYEFEKAHSTVRLGGSNIYNNVHIEAAGAPQIGALYYIGWMFDFTKLSGNKAGGK